MTKRVQVEDVNDWSDKECMELFLALLDKRVEVATAFIQNKETALLEKQVLCISCGKIEITSEPDELPFPLKIADANDIGRENIN